MYGIKADASPYNITPIRETGTLTNAFSTVNASAVVTVADTGHGGKTGDTVKFTNGTAIGSSGITLSGEYIMTVTGLNSYTVTHGSAAASTETNAGSADYAYELSIGDVAATQNLGYGGFTYGTSTYGTARPDVSPTGIAAAATWALDNWGEYLVACRSDDGKIPLTELGNLIDSAPEALNTLNELAAAINDDASYAATITTALGNKRDSSTASSTYLTQSNASSTYATQTALSAKLDSSAFTYASITIPVYTAVADLPSAGDNHGRWAHVHGEGAMYFAHGGSWYRALSQSDLYVSTNPQAAGYTVLTSDLGKMIEMSGGGTLTITDSASFPAGFTVDVLQTTSSQVTIAGNGFTPNATPGLKLRTQWSSATLIKRALNSWVVLGDLSA